MDRKLENLASLRVTDVMNSSVVTLSSCSTIREAADLFAKHKIHGAPVVDEYGHCVGVFSLVDAMPAACSQEVGGSSIRSGDDFTLIKSGDSKTFQIEHDESDCVRELMSTAIQTIDGQRSLIEAARWMHEQHVQRLVVVDALNHPVGIITPHDILGALADVDNASD